MHSPADILPYLKIFFHHLFTIHNFSSITTILANKSPAFLSHLINTFLSTLFSLSIIFYPFSPLNHLHHSSTPFHLFCFISTFALSFTPLAFNSFHIYNFAPQQSFHLFSFISVFTFFLHKSSTQLLLCHTFFSKILYLLFA